MVLATRFPRIRVVLNDTAVDAQKWQAAVAKVPKVEPRFRRDVIACTGGTDIFTSATSSHIGVSRRQMRLSNHFTMP